MHPVTNAPMLPTKQSTASSRYLQSNMKYTSPEANITQQHISQQPPQPISHPTTRHDRPDPQTKKKIPSRLNP